MPSAIELAQGDPQLIAAIQRSRRLLGRKALIAAAASAVPLPGVDWAADAALLTRLVPQISAEFGLSVTQIERLAPHERDRIQKAASAVGALLVGKFVTRELLLRLARHAGIRLTAQQAAKYVPVAGQVVSAALGYAALRTLGELHIRDCVKVAQSVGRRLPSPLAPEEGGPDRPRTPSRLTRTWDRLRLR
ncbi:hypothetical protein [Variovorax sp. PBL-E5]|uniref:hypothetical protein n=1 Tax=Variovorax sp. PBL-E5 TaxID=434014 RepID=UPI00131905B6|nr:hypothetical protein [Variovorax sp. PBL-E5]VTU28272.1 hypothetical protein E5CHR_02576 [Variovorax sp. PBL-E5]